MLLFGVMQCNNILLASSFLINKSSIGCLNIMDHEWICIVNITFLFNSYSIVWLQLVTCTNWDNQPNGTNLQFVLHKTTQFCITSFIFLNRMHYHGWSDWVYNSHVNWWIDCSWHPLDCRTNYQGKGGNIKNMTPKSLWSLSSQEGFHWIIQHPWR